MRLGPSQLAVSSVLLCCLGSAAAGDDTGKVVGSEGPSCVPLEEHFAGLDRSWFSTLAGNPKDFLKKAFKTAQEEARKAGHYYPYVRSVALPGTYLYECACQHEGSHYRLSSSPNMRTEMEDLIIDHVVAKFLGSVRMLSLGSGGCLQELILAARLAEAGVKSINLALVEPDRACVDSYEDLSWFLRRMEEVYGMQIGCEHFKHVTDVDTKEPFDVVYAIDYDDYDACMDHSGGEENFDRNKHGFLSTGNPYFAAVDLIKAANLTIAAKNALVVMSYKEDIISLTQETYRSKLVEFGDLSLSKLKHDAVDLFYLNAALNNLLFNLEYFSTASKPLLINRAILREEDRDGVATFLKHRGISCEFVDDAAALVRLEETGGLVVDYTIFNEEEGETAIPEVYSKPNISIVRMSFVKSLGESKPEVYQSLAGVPPDQEQGA